MVWATKVITKQNTLRAVDKRQPAILIVFAFLLGRIRRVITVFGE